MNLIALLIDRINAILYREEGQDAIEYLLVIGVVSLAIVAGAKLFGISSVVTQVQAAVDAVV